MENKENIVCGCGSEKAWDEACCPECKETQKEERQVVEIPQNQEVESTANIIKMAIAQGSDLDELEKLLTLKERYEANEAKKSYHKAMSEFKANPPKITKDKQVSFPTSKGQTQYKHATLANVTQKVNETLAMYGLSVSWLTTQNGAISVTCKITHIQGHSEETTLTAKADDSGSKNAIQAMGSTITYLERYTLLALAGLATHDQDDDGNAREEVEYIDDKQLSMLRDALAELNAKEAPLCKYFNIEKLETLPKKHYQNAVMVIQAKKDKNSENN